MWRKHEQLSAKSVEAKRRTGYYLDGGGLYLQVAQAAPDDSGKRRVTKSWIFRFTLGGRTREMGLGPLHTITLAEARQKALECRKKMLDGIDPIEARDAERTQRMLTEARAITFRECAASYIKSHRAGWKNEKHAEQWENTIETYAGPVIGALPVQSVDTALVVKVLDPIWTEKPETASRLRARIEKVLDWATVRGYRTGDNPARWRGHLDKLLAKLDKRKRVKHHAALPYREIAEFIGALRAEEGTAARALEFTILTAARTGEAIGATRSEFDLKAGMWIVPAERMKGHREHRVALSPRAVQIIKESPEVDGSGYVFPGARKGALSNMAMAELLKRMKRSDITVHGFRSTFRDWAAEQTNYPREVCEMALAHAIGNQTEAAYRRGDLFEKRRRLMYEWAKYCETRKRGDVVQLRRKRA